MEIDHLISLTTCFVKDVKEATSEMTLPELDPLRNEIKKIADELRAAKDVFSIPLSVNNIRNLFTYFRHSTSVKM
jgi:hypothetical protein